MWAPVEERWSLAMVMRWWGSWAESERRNMLVHYLLDELYMYEEGHGDALCPIPQE
ncbi:hypothetical protein CALCODRAFT_417163, partial [Calocera cornea HHB12733]